MKRACLLLGCCVALSLVAEAREPQNSLPATGTIEYAFTPGDDAAGLIVRTIDAATSQVLVQAFSLGTIYLTSQKSLTAGRIGL
ncbi:MAG TPA: hypothetical protein VHB46_13750 [Burkholderiales bacterium]|nr:hypothetical protein [Burkholderiales bacterium]